LIEDAATLEQERRDLQEFIEATKKRVEIEQTTKQN
jgi:hypothetical protein